MIDLRSDTVTRPSAAMRQAMSTAVVGDDVYGEDPTVNALQERVAALLGKEAALFVPSGVMGNQLALKAHTKPGDEVIVEYDAHIFQYETAAPSMMSQVQLHPVRGLRGILTADQVEGAIRPGAYYYPATTLVCLENTHNKAGGTIYPLEQIQAIGTLASRKGLRFHLDGARLWNACVATGITPAEYVHSFDSVSVCFSKGLGAPVGSALAGTGEFIERARKYRKIFGGGMRQAGILAAGALYALDNNMGRLAEDHLHARVLAAALSGMRRVHIDPDSVETNIVLADVKELGKTAEEVIDLLEREGVLVSDAGPTILRFVTHLDLSRNDVDRAVAIIRKALNP